MNVREENRMERFTLREPKFCHKFCPDFQLTPKCIPRVKFKRIQFIFQYSREHNLISEILTIYTKSLLFGWTLNLECLPHIIHHMYNIIKISHHKKKCMTHGLKHILVRWFRLESMDKNIKAVIVNMIKRLNYTSNK